MSNIIILLTSIGLFYWNYFSRYNNYVKTEWCFSWIEMNTFQLFVSKVAAILLGRSRSQPRPGPLGMFISLGRMQNVDKKKEKKQGEKRKKTKWKFSNEEKWLTPTARVSYGSSQCENGASNGSDVLALGEVARLENVQMGDAVMFARLLETV